MTRLLPLLLVLFALTGCRESLTAPDPVADPDPIGPSSDVRSMYVKAPALMVEGETVDVRAEPLGEAVYYAWAFSGDGNVSTRPNDPYGRYRVLAAEGIQPGPMLITARAYDDAGLLVAEGTKAVEVLER